MELSIRANADGPRINRNIYGHFAEHLGRCVYEGVWVGEDSPIPNTRGIRNDVVQALRVMGIPNLRWPGGCFADEYHWMDGIGPGQCRPASINSHWGGVVEDNRFGTHEFLDLCDQLGCEPYICGNVGSGTVREMQTWIEYLTADDASAMPELRRRNGRPGAWKIPYWGVGNENWGCGGNMTAEQYACEFRRYATYCRNIHGNNLYRIACGPNAADYHWTEVMMREGRPGHLMNGLSLHYYTVPGGWGKQTPATEFSEANWYETMKQALFMDELVTKHSAIMDRFDPGAWVGLIVDEWGAWHGVEPGTNPGFLYQQNTMRDALVAALTLNIFNRHCRRVKMANIAQLANVLQAPILTAGDRLVLTPTYHVFEMFKGHQAAALAEIDVPTDVADVGDGLPAISASASRSAGGRFTISICNIDASQGRRLVCRLGGYTPREARGRVLGGTALNAHNTFDEPNRVQPVDLPVQMKGGEMVIELPPASVAVVEAI